MKIIVINSYQELLNIFFITSILEDDLNNFNSEFNHENLRDIF